MLRSIFRSKSLLSLPRRTLSTKEPSGTTTAIIKNLSASSNETNLKLAILDTIKLRKLEVEPGCSIHLLNEAEATFVSSMVTTKFDYEGTISPTTMPSLLLQNLPSSICSQRLEKAFGRFQPKLIRLVGSSSLQVSILVSSPHFLLYFFYFYHLPWANC